ncbi:hypothetical protein N7452_008542 [Penicillium brevicompactum]|uniref:Uncharacterized protein n=1 Tax=Penicillium brevicompactum TaxID=5074 RepID=A0A9W9Q6L9_PENBR|nr:hypothetical protein N7452_008542 [Penicillium brevicompactum]
MNWTGGQLQRHHTRSGLLTKAQKQNFAKSRLKGTASLPSSPFRNFPEGLGTRKDDAANRTAINNQAGEPVSHLPAHRPAHLTGHASNASELSQIKRQLLEEPDWAAVAVTRPLELSFTSSEEVERFGKRRRLNDKDRKRVSDNVPSFLELPSHIMRNPRSVIDSIEGIQIEINGQPVVQSHDSSVAINSLSSQSMLLDREGSLTSGQDVEKDHMTATWVSNLFARPP